MRLHVKLLAQCLEQSKPSALTTTIVIVFNHSSRTLPHTSSQRQNIPLHDGSNSHYMGEKKWDTEINSAVTQNPHPDHIWGIRDAMKGYPQNILIKIKN